MNEEDLQIKNTRAGGEFLPAFAHQIGTSLAIMRWTLEEMSTSPSIASDPQNKEYVGNLLAVSDRMARSVGNLLRAARMEHATELFSHNPETISLPTMLRTITEAAAPLAKKSQITLRLHVSDMPVFVHADKDTLTGSIENIIDNAIKYSPEGKNGAVDITLAAHNGVAKISVRDDGIGIPADDQKHIFEKFFRGRNARESKIGGTGLGLFIVKKMIEGNGGTLSFESAEGNGTTFHITLPAVEER